MRLGVEQTSNTVLSSLIELISEGNISLKDILFDVAQVHFPVLFLHRPFGDIWPEWRLTMQHFVHEHSDTPDIKLLVVARPEDHLRAQVVGRPAVSIPQHFLGAAPAEVRDFEAFVGDQDVLGLNVPV